VIIHVPVTLTEGDYTLTQFASELQTKLNEAVLPSHRTHIVFVVTGNLKKQHHYNFINPINSTKRFIQNIHGCRGD
jgi:hypothetical protein